MIISSVRISIVTLSLFSFFVSFTPWKSGHFRRKYYSKSSTLSTNDLFLSSRFFFIFSSSLRIFSVYLLRSFFNVSNLIYKNPRDSVLDYSCFLPLICEFSYLHTGYMTHSAASQCSSSS